MRDNRDVTPRALVALAMLAFGLGGVGAALVLSAGRLDRAGPVVAFGLVIGWAFVGVGLAAWRRRPANRVGALLAATGAAWFTTGLVWTEQDVLYTFGLALSALVYAVLAHMLLAFPSGRLGSPVARGAVGAAYVVALGGQVAVLPFLHPSVTGSCPCPENLALVRRDDGLARVLIDVSGAAGAAVAVVVVLLLAMRWRNAGLRSRRALAPVAWTGAAVLILLSAYLLTGAEESGSPFSAGLLLAALGALTAVPFAFLTGLVRTRFFEASAVGSLIDRLAGSTADLRDDVARALGDETVRLAYWLPERGGYADVDGYPIDLPAAGNGRAVIEVSHEGRPVGAIEHDSALLDEAQLVRRVGAAAALALDNQRLQADLRARVVELERSRAQVVEAGDRERRRLERDLHDGAQQRLVGLRLALGLIEQRFSDDPAGRELVADARSDLDDALVDLRHLARGLHPALLGTRGLAAAVRSLAARSPITTTVVTSVEVRLPSPVETAAYFVIAESLTNVAKHAAAGSATVRLALDRTALEIEVTDDGTGGADGAGDGLQGLAARVEALDGTLTVGPGKANRGTCVRARIPVAQ